MRLYMMRRRLRKQGYVHHHKVAREFLRETVQDLSNCLGKATTYMDKTGTFYGRLSELNAHSHKKRVYFITFKVENSGILLEIV